MADTFYVKRNDAKIEISGTVLDVNENPVDLTGATLLLQCRRPYESTPVIEGTATAANQTTNTGEWSYSFTADDLANTADEYRVTLQATWGDGHIESFPSHGYNTLIIEEEVA